MSDKSLTFASRFLVGVATAVIVLHFLANLVLDVRQVYPGDEPTLGDHLCNWTLIALSTWKLLAHLLLATWIGLLLRRTFPNPSKTRYVILSVIAIAGLGLYCYGVLTNMWPLHFFGGCMVAAMFQGYMFNPARAAERRPVESAAMSVAMAIVCLGLFLLDRHRTVTIFGMMPFVYNMLLLSFSDPVQLSMSKSWVVPAASVLSALSFIAVILALPNSQLMSFRYLLPVWSVIVQPVVVYPFILLYRKKHRMA
jgi:hypothetical protein